MSPSQFLAVPVGAGIVAATMALGAQAIIDLRWRRTIRHAGSSDTGSSDTGALNPVSSTPVSTFGLGANKSARDSRPLVDGHRFRRRSRATVAPRRRSPIRSAGVSPTRNRAGRACDRPG